MPNHAGGRFVITAEPIKKASVGHAYISGVVPCKVFYTDYWNQAGGMYADVIHNEATKLQISISQTPVQILFRHWDNTGVDYTYWALVRLGLPENPIRRAKCVEAAGAYNEIHANLFRNGVEQTTGPESNILVTCDLTGGATNLNAVMPKLQSGDIIKVTLLENKWYCLETFTPYVSCECSEVQA